MARVPEPAAPVAQPAVTYVMRLPKRATMCQSTKYYSCIFKLLHRRLGPTTPTSMFILFYLFH